MSRKYFEMIAKRLNDSYRRVVKLNQQNGIQEMLTLIVGMADDLEKVNSNFDRKRFISAALDTE